MTLTKQRPKRAPVAHRKRTGQHHTKNPHYVKAYWPYLPILAVLVMGMFASSWMSGAHRDVKGYATEMSIQNLLDETNKQRIANGVGSLALNGKLDTAAQNKANDMAARDYWSHNTPDGQTPWSFITAAGYTYITVGENLAYGFATSADTVTGWMNSPPHRENLLNAEFADVGFGIANIPNYQSSGPQTLVVAMYGKQPSAPAPAPAPVAAKPRVVAAAPVTTPVAPTTPPETLQDTPSPAAEKPQPTKDDTVVSTKKPTEIVEQKRVARVQIMTAGQASWSLFAMSMIASGALIIFLLKHTIAWHRVIRRGERFMFKHPLLDFVIMSVAVVAFILSQTSGLIK